MLCVACLLGLLLYYFTTDGSAADVAGDEKRRVLTGVVGSLLLVVKLEVMLVVVKLPVKLVAPRPR